MTKDDMKFIDIKDRTVLAEALKVVKSSEHRHILIAIHQSEVVQIEKIGVRKPRDCVCRSADPKTGSKPFVKTS